MRLLAAILLSIPLLAQDAASPAAAEPKVTLEVGNRWSSGPAGSLNAYRSMVNLGEGPKILGADVSLRNASGILFEKFDLSAFGWGGEPQSTLHAAMEKHSLYRLSVDYRNLAFFNALPSYANPGLEQGPALIGAISEMPGGAAAGERWLASQRSFNLRRRMIDTTLDLFPDRRITPFLAYQRDWGTGDGVTDFVAYANEFPVRNIFADKTDHYRGGVRILFNRFHATLEQGGLFAKDDQRAYLPPTTNLGNRTTSFFGQRLLLNELNQAYRARGEGAYSKALFTATPASWLTLSGQFLYSQPRSEVKLVQDSRGQFFSRDLLSFFTAERLLASTEAKQPHTAASFSLEARPHGRLRVLESVTTDRFHTSGNLLSFTDNLTPGVVISQLPSALERLMVNYNRQHFNVLFDAARGLTLRGGHSYVWGDASVRAPALNQTGQTRAGEIRTNAALAGFNWRPAAKLSLFMDLEKGVSDGSYFRTSLYDYWKLSTRARYQVLNSVALTANFSVLDNDNPTAGSNYNFENRNNSLTVFWTPAGGKRVSITADYTRSTLVSEISYVVPQTLQFARSYYAERAHTGTAMVDLVLPDPGAGPLRLTLGGSLFVSSGTRPTEYYQPLVRLLAPLHKRVSLIGEWRWYGFGEMLYGYEAFRTHHFIAGLRFSI